MIKKKYSLICFTDREYQTVDKLKKLFFAALAPHCVFPLTCAAEKHIISEKPLIKRFFKGTGVVLAGIECSPKIKIFERTASPPKSVSK